MIHVDPWLWLVPAMPLAGFLVNGTVGGRLDRGLVGAVAVAGPLVAFVVSVLAFLQATQGHDFPTQTVWTWMAAGALLVDVGLQADGLSAVMLLNVTGIGTAIHLYSYGYMKDDPGFARFMAYLNLFLASMIVLVMADNLLLLFVGWEGVGLCSYLLIGFWYEDFANVDAGRKAFVVNRIGDFAFLVGAFALFALTGTFAWDGMEAALHGMDLGAVLSSGPLAGLTIGGALALAGLCLFGGATGKSAQIPLYVWLPDAMAGPTPVSALIHAATMVTAGIYLLGRMDFLYVVLPDVTQVVAVVAAATALLSGVIAIGQNDIKKVLAYSTVSQLGFMFCGMATTLWHTGLFHVVTHAFFKALLFLGAGAVIVAMHHEQDIRKMGGLWRDLRGISILFLIGAVALMGVPPFAGFFSKDEILAAVHLAGVANAGVWPAVFWMLVVAAALTAFYTTRLVVLTFFGRPHDEHRHLHPVHWTMTVVLVLLAGLSVGGGWLGPGIESATHAVWVESHWLHELPHEAEHTSHTFALWCSLAAVAIGTGAGLIVYALRPSGLAEVFRSGPGRPVAVLVENKLYVDEMYDRLFARPLRAGADLLFSAFDRAVIDKFFVEGSGNVVVGAARAAAMTQVGAVSGATTAILVGAVAVLLWMAASSG